ncbi:RluA family pseudouridine synthase [Mucilaginibacter ginkgonis]|uniref:Pseudouridine synthase n=1 Tax=Mucilaginibacter ginkgonis TaxID=2682091 RepID=A0A6I4I219_9SPHI|nr:RluA family pseudouridine synthase [Mucilaginibacter ginkgonis]QQL48442.1 RluA family pseudouridine synthase [Mucilaginibacter ginkgonis]
MSQQPELIEQEEQDLYEHFRIIVDKGQSLLRVDKFLMHRIENATRSRIQNGVELGNVLVNDKAIKSSYKVKPNDVISVVLPHPPRDTEVYPENIPLNIVYEDDDVLVINKPAGMVVHPGYNNYSGTLVNGLVFHFQQLPVLPGNDGRPGLVHRIDKDTSGLLLISKNERSMAWLARQFYEHTIARKYVALVWGDIETDGTVTGYIGRSVNDRRVMSIYDDPEKGKWSVTHYKVLERLGYVTLIECRLETGRTHQIRAHMKHIGHPLFADNTYGGDRIIKGTVFGKYKQFVENNLALMPGQALHAQTLGFLHPSKKERMNFEAPLPQNFETVIARWRNYIAVNTKAND